MVKILWRKIKIAYTIHCLKFWVRIVKFLIRRGMSMETIDKVTFEMACFMHGCYWYLVPSLFVFGALL